MDLAERLKKVLVLAGMKHNEFALSVGVRVDRLKNLINGKVKRLTEAEVLAISRVHGVRGIWLSEGKGPMRLESGEVKIVRAAVEMKGASAEVEAMGVRPEMRETATRLLFSFKRQDGEGVQGILQSLAGLQQQLLQADTASVSFYDVQASAGNGAAVTGEDVIGQFSVRKNWLSRKGFKATDLSMISARGDSMEPTIHHGDLLLVAALRTEAMTDGIYLIEIGGDLFCKRLQRQFGGGVTIRSDNPKYDPQHLPAESAAALHVVGRIVWVGGER